MIFDGLHTIPNNKLEFQLVSTFHQIVGHCFDLFTMLVTKSWTPSRSRNQEITVFRFKISLFILIYTYVFTIFAGKYFG